MGIEKDAQGIGDEIQAAEEWRDSHLHNLDEMRREASGDAFREGVSPKERQPQGSSYEYVSITLPRMLHSNPRVRVTSRDPAVMTLGEGQRVSDADVLRFALNRWSRDLDLSQLMIPYATDGLFAYGSGVVFQKPLVNPPSNEDLQLGKGRVPMLPHWKRILPERRFWDPIADSRDELRFSGHTYYLDEAQIKERIAQNEDWDEAVLQRAKEANTDRQRLDSGRRTKDVPKRGEIELRDVWIPEHETEPDGDEEARGDEGFHGTIYTLANVGSADGQSWAFARSARAYFGPREGMYTDWGGYSSGDDTFWIAPLVGLRSQMEHLNKMAQAVEDANASYKKGVAVSDTDPKLKARIADFLTNGILTVNSDDLRSAIQAIEVGGATPALYEALDRAREQYERTSGINDARRGSLAGAGSATEVAVADNAATVRFEFLNRQFQRGVTGILRKAAWYFLEDPRSRYPLGPELAQEMGLEPGNYWYRPPVDEIPFDAYELEIEMYSMERGNQGVLQRQMLDYAALFNQTIQVAATYGPQVADFDAFLKTAADVLNVPDLAVKLNLEALAATFEQQQAQAAGAGGGGGPVGAVGASGAGSPGQYTGAAAGAASAV